MSICGCNCLCVLRRPLSRVVTHSVALHCLPLLAISAVDNGISGYNVDWEPTSPNISTADAVAYAGFLDDFANALHDVGLSLSVDVATWTPLWNYTLLAATTVDQIMVMSTYTGLRGLQAATPQLFAVPPGLLEMVNRPDVCPLPSLLLVPLSVLMWVGAGVVRCWR